MWLGSEGLAGTELVSDKRRLAESVLPLHSRQKCVWSVWILRRCVWTDSPLGMVEGRWIWATVTAVNREQAGGQTTGRIQPLP